MPSQTPKEEPLAPEVIDFGVLANRSSDRDRDRDGDEGGLVGPLGAEMDDGVFSF